MTLYHDVLQWRFSEASGEGFSVESILASASQVVLHSPILASTGSLAVSATKLQSRDYTQGKTKKAILYRIYSVQSYITIYWSMLFTYILWCSIAYISKISCPLFSPRAFKLAAMYQSEYLPNSLTHGSNDHFVSEKLLLSSTKKKGIFISGYQVYTWIHDSWVHGPYGITDLYNRVAVSKQHYPHNLPHQLYLLEPMESNHLEWVLPSRMTKEKQNVMKPRTVAPCADLALPEPRQRNPSCDPVAWINTRVWLVDEPSQQVWIEIEMDPGCFSNVQPMFWG